MLTAVANFSVQCIESFSFYFVFSFSSYFLFAYVPNGKNNSERKIFLNIFFVLKNQNLILEFT